MQPVSFREARSIVEQHAALLTAVEPEPVELLNARGRVLAEDIASDRDLPPFARATRDGFALRAADLAQLPARLKVVGEIRAGADASVVAACALKSGEAVEIMTGAPAPPGADAIVMVEYTRREGAHVVVERGANAGDNIVPAGAEARAGAVVLTRGTRLGAQHIAVAASVGRTQLRVHRRPRVAILTTGDEVVDVAAAPGPSEIRNSNGYALAAQVEQAGGMPVLLPIARDELEPLRRLLQQGLSSDLLLISGGVSMGKYDLVAKALAGLQAEFFLTGALIQPGKPIAFGRARRQPESPPTYFFGLPGNPVSVAVTFAIFARAALDALSGAHAQPLLFLQARLAADIKTKTGLTRFLPAVLSGRYEKTEVRLAPWQGSGDVVGAARANCYIVLPPDREKIAAGEMMPVLLP